jgi:hypothetical protein
MTLNFLVYLPEEWTLRPLVRPKFSRHVGLVFLRTGQLTSSFHRGSKAVNSAKDCDEWFVRLYQEEEEPPFPKLAASVSM